MQTHVTEYNVKIFDSYAISKREFKTRLNIIKSENPDCKVFSLRPMYSLKKEWALHNGFYALGIARSRTKDVDLNAPLCWLIQAVYVIFGGIFWVFIK